MHRVLFENTFLRLSNHLASTGVVEVETYLSIVYVVWGVLAARLQTLSSELFRKEVNLLTLKSFVPVPNGE